MELAPFHVETPLSILDTAHADEALPNWRFVFERGKAKTPAVGALVFCPDDSLAALSYASSMSIGLFRKRQLSVCTPTVGALVFSAHDSLAYASSSRYDRGVDGSKTEEEAS